MYTQLCATFLVLVVLLGDVPGVGENRVPIREKGRTTPRMVLLDERGPCFFRGLLPGPGLLLDLLFLVRVLVRVLVLVGFLDRAWGWGTTWVFPAIRPAAPAQIRSVVEDTEELMDVALAVRAFRAALEKLHITLIAFSCATLWVDRLRVSVQHA